MAFPASTTSRSRCVTSASAAPGTATLLGSDPMFDEHTDAGFHHLVWVLDGGTLFGIHQHDIEAPDEKFSELRVGLDHVGFGCANRAELESWVARLGELGIAHGGSSTRRTGRG